MNPLLEQITILQRAVAALPIPELSRTDKKKILLLSTVEKNPNCTSRLVSEKIGIPMKSVSDAFNDMKKSGYLTSIEYRREGRTLLWSITPSGKAFIDKHR